MQLIQALLASITRRQKKFQDPVTACKEGMQFLKTALTNAKNSIFLFLKYQRMGYNMFSTLIPLFTILNLPLVMDVVTKEQDWIWETNITYISKNSHNNNIFLYKNCAKHYPPVGSTLVW